MGSTHVRAQGTVLSYWQPMMREDSELLGKWIILGWICRRWDVGIWTGLGRPRIETGGGRL